MVDFKERKYWNFHESNTKWPKICFAIASFFNWKNSITSAFTYASLPFGKELHSEIPEDYPDYDERKYYTLKFLRHKRRLHVNM